jgi:hypothetical protein
LQRGQYECVVLDGDNMPIQGLILYYQEGSAASKYKMGMADEVIAQFGVPQNISDALREGEEFLNEWIQNHYH